MSDILLQLLAQVLLPLPIPLHVHDLLLHLLVGAFQLRICCLHVHDLLLEFSHIFQKELYNVWILISKDSNKLVQAVNSRLWRAIITYIQLQWLLKSSPVGLGLRRRQSLATLQVSFSCPFRWLSRRSGELSIWSAPLLVSPTYVLLEHPEWTQSLDQVGYPACHSSHFPAQRALPHQIHWLCLSRCHRLCPPSLQRIQLLGASHTCACLFQKCLCARQRTPLSFMARLIMAAFAQVMIACY